MTHHTQELKDRIIARWNQGGISTAGLAEQFGMPSKDAVCGLLRRARKAGVDVRLEFAEGTAFGRLRVEIDPVDGHEDGFTVNDSVGFSRHCSRTNIASSSSSPSTPEIPSTIDGPIASCAASAFCASLAASGPRRGSL